MGLYILIIAGGILVILAIYMSISRAISRRWQNQPPDEGKFLDSGGMKLFYRAKGKGDPVVIILNTCGSSSMEWWPIQNEIRHARVICFERPGYSWSNGYPACESASDISNIIDSILKFERIKKPVILVANGLASIYVHHYACTRQHNIAGAILINPVPVDYKHWSSSLRELEDFKEPEVMAKKHMTLAKSGLLRPFSPYKHQLSQHKYRKLLTEFYNSPSTYFATLKELAGIERSLGEIREAENFPSIPLYILFSTEEALIRDWARHGTSDYSARQAGRMYRILSMDNLYLSPKSQLIELQNGIGSINIENPKGIAEHINNMIKSLR